MFLPAVHRFRSLAILTVIAMHLDLACETGSWWQRIQTALVSNGSVLFLFVAGLLFQHLSANFTYGRYLRSKLRNVLVPYVVMSLPALLFQAVRHTGIFASGPQTTWETIKTIVLALLTARHMQVPFWFIPMMAVFYLAAPLFLWLDRRPRSYVILWPLLVNAMLCHRPVGLNHLAHALIYFLPVYLAGMWFSRHRQLILAVVTTRLLSLSLFCVGLMAFEVVVLHGRGAIFSARPYSTEVGVVDLDLPLKLLVGVVVLAWLTRFEKECSPLLDSLAGLTFGLFFVHKYVSDVLELVELRLLHRDLPGNPLTFCLTLGLVTLVSWALVMSARRLLGPRSRLVIGC